jgi:hypothetical protein
MRKVELSDDLEMRVDELVSQGIFHSFQSAVNELVTLGLASILSGGRRTVPPGAIPQPEKPNIPDPSRDILKM